MLALLQNVLQPVRLLYHIAARIGREQPGDAVLEILKPPFYQLGAGISHNGVGHGNAQSFKNTGRRKRLTAVRQRLFGAVASAADVVGQKLAAVIHIGIVGDAKLGNAFPQGVQCCLASGAGRNVPAGKNAAPGIQPGTKVQAVQGAVRPHALHIKGVGIADPKVICVDALVLAAYVGAAQVIVFFVTHAAQNHYRVRHRLGLAVKGVVAWQRHGLRHILPGPFLSQFNAPGQRKLGFIKIQRQKHLLYGLRQLGRTLAGLAAHVHQRAIVTLADRRPFAVQDLYTELLLRVLHLAQQHKLFVTFRFLGSCLVAVGLPAVDRCQPVPDFAAFLGGVGIQRFADGGGLVSLFRLGRGRRRQCGGRVFRKIFLLRRIRQAGKWYQIGIAATRI